MDTGTYVCLWEYHVRPDAEAMFLAHYDAEGAWSQLFRRGLGYLGSELYRDERVRDRFLSIDRWESDVAFQAFKIRFASEYESLDRVCAEFTTSERRLGEFAAAGRAHSD